MITYLAKFCPSLADHTRTLRQLVHKDTAWTWDATYDNALAKLKRLVSNSPVLRLYDPSIPVTVSVDASSYGLGATLLQDGHPIEYSSRTLTQTQQRYAQIEKELLAVQFGLEKYHQYVYGQSVIVETDHKPSGSKSLAASTMDTLELGNA